MHLAIDTSTATASLAIVRDSQVLAELSWCCGQNHSVELVPRLNWLLKQAGLELNSISSLSVARGLGIKEYTPSPSFVLIREFYGRLPLYHMDLYRLDRIQEIADLGLDDYLYGNGICVIEWAEKGLGLLPPQHLLIELSHLSSSERRLKLKPHGLRYREMAAQLLEGNKP